MKRDRFLKIALFLSGAFFFLGCKSDDPVKARQEAIKQLYKNGTVKIAIANSFVHNTTKMWEGAVLAQEKINRDALLPVHLELVKYDDGGTTITGMKTAYEIASDEEICAVIGHGYSDISLSCSLIYQYFGILMFNYISTTHSLTERNNPLIFSNMPNDSDFGREIAQLCDQNGYSNVLIYYLENASGTSLSNAFEINCNKFGISVVSRDSYDMTTSPQEFERMAKRWKNNFIFDALFLAGRMPSIQHIIETLRQNGISCPILGADPFDDPLLTHALSKNENGRIFAVSNYDSESDNPRFKEFFAAFKEKYGEEPDQEALQVYDALTVLSRAIAMAHFANPAEIAEALRKENWKEAAGPYTFDKTGAIQDRTLTAKVFQNGAFVKLPAESTH